MKQHNEILQAINPNLKIVERFIGGMSNFTYLVQNPLTKNYYTFRIPGTGADNFVDFNIERMNLAIIDELAINSKTIYTDPSCGYKISSYIPGTIVDDTVDYQQVVTLLKILHNSQLNLANHYQHIERLEKYEKIHSRNDQKYYDLKNEFIKIYNEHLKQHIIYPCHNDAQVANMITDKHHNLHLLDWEFAGTNDYIYDIASFGNRDFSMAEDLLKVYVDTPTNDHYLRLYAWRLFQCLQWYNVASYKDEIGLSKELNIDFNSVCTHYLNLAETMFTTTKKYLD